MRDELKKFDWHTYGLKFSDFDYTIDLIDKLINSQNVVFEIEMEKVKMQYKNEPDIYEEIISDVGHYDYLDNLFLNHFALTRSQGIFEGILKQEFFPQKNLIGLKRKLDYVKNLNYSLNDYDYDQILEWGKLRNALSHFPPEQFRPGLLDKNDVKEYITLAKKILSNLIEQKK